jgi:two-component system sensor histidine kinase KdpD
VSESGLTGTVVQSIANVAAIGLERARAHRAAARMEAARQSGEVRAAVLDALAHEFKTPLTATRAAAGELLEASRPGERDRELAEIVDEGLEQLQRLVSDAVQVLRIDAGTFAVHRQRLQLTDVVARTLDMLAPRLTEHGVLNRISPELIVDADPALLGLALRQLVDNAVKYSAPTSSIELSATSNGVTDIVVRNSGSHIPAAERARIFDRFYRGSQAGHVVGAGLGLAIVQQIAHAHGGAVGVDSDRISGTTFTLSLPRGVSP